MSSKYYERVWADLKEAARVFVESIGNATKPKEGESADTIILSGLYGAAFQELLESLAHDKTKFKCCLEGLHSLLDRIRLDIGTCRVVGVGQHSVVYSLSMDEVVKVRNQGDKNRHWTRPHTQHFPRKRENDERQKQSLIPSVTRLFKENDIQTERSILLKANQVNDLFVKNKRATVVDRQCALVLERLHSFEPSTIDKVKMSRFIERFENKFWSFMSMVSPTGIWGLGQLLLNPEVHHQRQFVQM